jgi:hypothetical protein
MRSGHTSFVARGATSVWLVMADPDLPSFSDEHLALDVNGPASRGQEASGDWRETHSQHTCSVAESVA